MKFSENSTFTVGALFSSVEFNYVVSGLIMPVVLLIGAVGNICTLLVLCRKSLSSVPTILLQCLTIQALFDSLIAVHTDVIPALRGFWATSNLFEEHDLHALDLHAHYIGHFHGNGSFHNLFDFIHMTKYDNESLTEFMTSQRELMNDVQNTTLMRTLNDHVIEPHQVRHDGGSPRVITTLRPRALSLSTYSNNDDGNRTLPFPEVDFINHSCGSCLSNESLLANKLHRYGHVIVSEALERYAMYTNEHFGQLVTMTLALQQGVAVTWPVRSSKHVTIYRAKLFIVFLAILCCVIGTPQLIQELSNADHDHPETRAVVVDEHVIAMWTDYFTKVYAALSLVLAILLSVVNMDLLRKMMDVQSMKHNVQRLAHAKRTGLSTLRQASATIKNIRSVKDMKDTTKCLKQKCLELKRIKDGDKSGVNSSFFVIILVFFRLPIYVCKNTIDLISFGSVFEDVALVTKAMAVFRLVGMVQSAMSFLVLFMFAKKFRKTIKMCLKTNRNKYHVNKTVMNRGFIRSSTSTLCDTGIVQHVSYMPVSCDEHPTENKPTSDITPSRGYHVTDRFSLTSFKFKMESTSLDGEQMYEDVKHAVEGSDISEQVRHQRKSLAYDMI